MPWTVDFFECLVILGISLCVEHIIWQSLAFFEILWYYCPISGHLNFFDADTKKCKKTNFFIKRSFLEICSKKKIQDRTMRKLTSRAFRKCVTYWACEVLNGS